MSKKEVTGTNICTRFYLSSLDVTYLLSKSGSKLVQYCSITRRAWFPIFCGWNRSSFQKAAISSYQAKMGGWTHGSVQFVIKKQSESTMWSLFIQCISNEISHTISESWKECLAKVILMKYNGKNGWDTLNIWYKKSLDTVSTRSAKCELCWCCTLWGWISYPIISFSDHITGISHRTALLR